MACKGTTQTHLCISLTPAQYHSFLSGLRLSQSFSLRLRPTAGPLPHWCCASLCSKRVLFNFVHVFLVRDTSCFPGMEILHLRSSAINSSDSCAFSYNTMANLEEQVTPETKGTIVLRGQACDHKDTQVHLAHHLL